MLTAVIDSMRTKMLRIYERNKGALGAMSGLPRRNSEMVPGKWLLLLFFCSPKGLVTADDLVNHTAEVDAEAVMQTSRIDTHFDVFLYL